VQQADTNPSTLAEYAPGHVTDHLGGKLVVKITSTVVKRYRRMGRRRTPVTRKATMRCCCCCRFVAARELDLNCGLRDKELRELRWQQVDLLHKKQLTVGKSKTDAGTGRVIPLNDTVMIALESHAAWYIRRFGEFKPEWYVFPAGKGQPNDPTRPVTTLRTAWTKVRNKAKVVGRWHDNRTRWSRNSPSRARATR